MAKHSQILGLPEDVRQKLELDLTKGADAAELGRGLKAQGYLTDMSDETLFRAIRRYRLDFVTIPQEARRKSIERSPNPRVHKKVLEKAESFDVIAEWFNLIQEQQKRVAQWIKSGAGNLPSSAVRDDIKALAQMYDSFNKAAMDRGLVRKMPTQIALTVEDITIRDERELDVVMSAIYAYMQTRVSPGGRLGEFAVERLEHLEMRRGIHAVMEAIASVPDDQRALPSPEFEPNKYPQAEEAQAEEPQVGVPIDFDEPEAEIVERLPPPSLQPALEPKEPELVRGERQPEERMSVSLSGRLRGSDEHDGVPGLDSLW